MTKALGKDIKNFWFDDSAFDGVDIEWTEDDEPIEFEELEDSVKYDLNKFGWFNFIYTDKSISFKSAYIKWKNKQVTTTLLIEVPNETKDEIVLLLKQKNVKVVL